MFEQALKNIDDILYKDAGCTSELKYTELPYVLEHRNTKLAGVEAKAWDEEMTAGVAQAKNSAGNQL
jgi:hypothetical protein